MHHKCGRHDQGSGKAAMKYLLGLYDSKHRLRAGVEILRGDPVAIARLIDALKTKNKYTSSVIAFAKEDAPTDEELNDLIGDWERVAFAGLRKSQYMYCAVLHREDDGSCHIHIITPRVCLESGRSLNIAPPNHEYFFARWRNYWNELKGWAKPDDPDRARVVQPGVKLHTTLDELRGVIVKSKDQKAAITQHLMSMVRDGDIETHHDVLAELAEIGEINRIGRDKNGHEYVSLKIQDGDREVKVRLKGLLYGSGFNPELVIERSARTETAVGDGHRAEIDPGAVEVARRELEVAVGSRTNYNREYFGRPARAAGEAARRRNELRQEQSSRDQRLTRAGEFRDRYLELQDEETVGLGAAGAGLAGGSGKEKGAAPGERVDYLDLPVDAPGGRRLVGVDGIRIESDSSEGIIRYADTNTAVERSILQQSSRQAILPTNIINSYPTNGLNNGVLSGYVNDITSGENANGLYEPDSIRPPARGGHQQSGRFSRLPTLSGRRLDAAWPRASLLLPGLARPDMERGREVVSGSLRRSGSSTGRDASQGAETGRQGAHSGDSPNGLQPGAGAADAGLDANPWQQYLTAKRRHYADKKEAVDSVRAGHQKTMSDVFAKNKSDRSSLYREHRGADLVVARSLLAADQARAKLDLRDRQNAEIDAVSKGFPKYPEFRTWKANQTQKPGFLGVEIPAVKIDLRNYAGTADGSVVRYFDAAGLQSFTDTGRTVIVDAPNDKSAILASLQLCNSKFGMGKYDVTGGDVFRDQVVQVAAENGMKLKDPVLQIRVQKLALEIKARNAQESAYDPHRAIADAAIRKAIEYVRGAAEAVSSASLAIDSAGRKVSYAAATAGPANEAVERACNHVNKSISRVKLDMDNELEKFKKDVSIVDLAINEFGYELDKKESSKTYFVLRAGGDKIIVTRDEKDGHDVYCGSDPADRGSVIDFVKGRVGDNNAKLVKVRQTLRPWAPGAKKPAIKRPAIESTRPVATPKDRAAVVAAWTDMKPYKGTYLTQQRGIDQRLIQAFGVRQDRYGNAVFAHQDAGGITGYEVKGAPLVAGGPTHTRFVKGGDRALMLTRIDDAPIKRLVVTEAAIDTLSYAQMHHKSGTAYISTAGSNLSAVQIEQLKAVLERNSQATLVLACDNDLAGEKMAEQIKDLAPASMKSERQTPAQKDWNMDLQAHIKAQQVERDRRIQIAQERPRGL